MPPLTNLDFKDIVSILVPFLATVLAVWNETRKDSSAAPQPAAPRKGFTTSGYSALLLATAGLIMAALNTSEAKASGQETSKAMQTIQADLKEKLPGFITEALGSSQAAINDAVKASVVSTSEQLATSLKAATAEETARLRGQLSGTIAKSQEDLQGAVKGTIDSLGGSITTQITNGLTNSQQEIAKVVNAATTGAASQTTAAVSTAVQAAADTTSAKAQAAIQSSAYSMILQIPLQIPENSSRGLIGPLEGLVIDVGEVSKRLAFDVRVHGVGGYEQRFRITPKSKPSGATHSQRLVYNGVTYRIDMIIQTPSNLFGDAPDSLYCYIVAERPAA